MSVTDGQKSYENFEQDSLRSVKNGRTADSLENQKTALLKTVGSERSLHSGVSGNCFEVCLQSFYAVKLAYIGSLGIRKIV